MRLLAIFVTVAVTVAGFTVHHSAAQTDAVTFPSAEVAFIIGPQVKSGTSTIPGASWFDSTAVERGLTLCSAFPDVAHTPGNVVISGTVAVTNGSKIVIGSNTHFLTEVKDYAIIGNGAAGRIVKIKASVESDTQLTLTLPWQGTTLTGQSIASPSASEMDNYQGFMNYYDFGYVSYETYYRTGDQRFLDCARKVNDSWWSQPVIDYGKNLVSLSGESLAPRSISLNGLILRALDGRPEMWPWIRDYVRYQFNSWVEAPTNWTQKDPTKAGLYYGVRDGGFMTLYAANEAAVDPDPAIRAEFLAKVLRSAVSYYAALQSDDGSYRFSIEDSSPGALDGMTGIEQPFQVGILNEGMIAVHRLTGDPIVKAAILKSVEHEYLHSYNPNGWRTMYYFVHGKFNTGFSCETGCGSASNPFPPADGNLVSDARQLNATAISQFGYAYSITLDDKFRKWGDEIFDATYSGKDGYRGLAHYRGKEYDESYRSGGRYLAWRLGGTGGPLPSPTASPLPSVTATPTPTPTPPILQSTPSGNVSADGATGATITDSSGGTWTLGLNRETLRNGIHTGGGFGLMYKWFDGAVYVQGVLGPWYRWTGDAWAGAGDVEPGAVATPTPTATPIASPTPGSSPTPTTTPQPTPQPTPTPPLCVMTTNSPVIPAWGTGKLIVTLTGIPKSSTVSATSTSGQVTVTPALQPVNLGSAIVEFSLAAKKKSAVVTISGPCGTKNIAITVQ
jgi:hypothetical protein